MTDGTSPPARRHLPPSSRKVAPVVGQDLPDVSTSLNFPVPLLCASTSTLAQHGDSPTGQFDACCGAAGISARQVRAGIDISYGGGDLATGRFHFRRRLRAANKIQKPQIIASQPMYLGVLHPGSVRDHTNNAIK